MEKLDCIGVVNNLVLDTAQWNSGAIVLPWKGLEARRPPFAFALCLRNGAIAKKYSV
jgi:hypothetical protein